ncbi:hypothetical protein [Cellulosimicrobium arenosum]|nr:hypothetical protein [Cellulosimicrobium arenosum]
MEGHAMKRINVLGDRLLGALLPSARAEAKDYYCWYNYFSGGRIEKCCRIIPINTTYCNWL